MMKKINVLIVDDRDIIRDSLKLIFLNSKSIRIKDDASDGLEAMQLLEKNNYDVVLMDISMPNMNGIEATKRIKAIDSSVKVLANSFHVSPFVIRDMIKAGASGFIRKGETKNAYAEAIKTVYNGDIYLSDEINHKIYDQVLTYFKPSSGKKILST